MILETLIFFILMLGVGFFVTSYLKLEEDNLFVHLAVGLVTTCFVILELGYFGWLSAYGLLPLGVVGIYGIIFRRPKIAFDRNFWLVTIMAGMLVVFFALGSDMRWLEDNDPVEHSSGLVYIGEFHSILQPVPTHVRYLAPYPALYDALLSIPYQLTWEAPETLKLNNAILCGLAIAFAYPWLKQKYCERIAIWATFILFSIPCFMSHFIWSQTLAIMLMFPALYFYERQKTDESYVPGFLFVLAAALVFVAQPSVAFIFGLIMLINIWFGDNRLNELKLLAAAGMVSVMLFWLPVFAIYGIDNTLNLIHVSVVAGDDSSGGVIYSVFDLIDAPTSTKIDQATGFGWVIFLLALAGFLYAANEGMMLELALLAFCVIGIEGNALPVKLFPHRFWVFLAVPVSILAGRAAVRVLDAVGASMNCTMPPLRLPVAAGLILLVAFTSLSPKLEVQMMDWPPGMFVTQSQFAGYMLLQERLPANAMVYDFCSKETMMDGAGLRGKVWDDEVWNWKGINHSIQDDVAFLKRHGYQYAVIDESCLQYAGADAVVAKAGALADALPVRKDLSGGSFVVYEVAE